MAEQQVRKEDGMIRAKLAGGGPLGYATHLNVYPTRDPSGQKPKDDLYDTYIPLQGEGWYKRSGTYPNYTYKWEPRT